MVIADWILWSGGGAAIATGVGVMLWALLTDRLRGGPRHRRCPRCWYDMGGVPGLVCPECGGQVGSERRLHRSRRRWKPAAAGLVLTILGFAGTATPAVQARGWTTLMPTTVMIWMLPWHENYTYSLRLRQRISVPEMPLWQRRLLLRRCDDVVRTQADPNVRVQALIIAELVAGRMWHEGHGGGEAVHVLLRAVADDHPYVRGYAASILPAVSRDPAQAVPVLTPLAAADPDALVRYRAFAALKTFGPAAAPALDAAIIGLGRHEDGPDWHARLLAQREALVLLGAIGPANAQVSVPILAAALQRDDAAQRSQAALSLGQLGPSAAAAAPALISALDDPDRDVRLAALSALAEIGSTSESLKARLLEALDEFDRWGGRPAMVTILRLWPDEGLALLETWASGRADSDSLIAEIKSAARHAAEYAELAWRRHGEDR